MTKTVLITGGTGFVASWCIVELLRRGYTVRATVRSLAARSGPRKDLARLFAPTGTFISFFNDGFSVDCDRLARCLLDVAKHGADRSLLTNSALRGWISHRRVDRGPRNAGDLQHD